MKLQINWNALGVSATVACAIHCALLPLFISTMPLFGINILDNIYFEAGMILIALVIGGLTLFHGYRKHHHRVTPLILFITGMFFLIFKHFVSDTVIWLIIPSSILILLAYYLNWRFCRIAKHCHASDCNH
ncbi:MAG TPA: MerC domain-containing protein [Chitinophagaceae bacterium]|nr:MerC domain-containing protein [Chitinophagaceae bacterium]